VIDRSAAARDRRALGVGVVRGDGIVVAAAIVAVFESDPLAAVTVV
jgi:hypothetical protein